MQVSICSPGLGVTWLIASLNQLGNNYFSLSIPFHFRYLNTSSLNILEPTLNTLRDPLTDRTAVLYCITYTVKLSFVLSLKIIMKMLLFIYLRWGRKFGGIWVIDSSEMKENAAVVRKQLQNSSENTNNHEYNQSKLRIVLLSYSRLLLVSAARHVDCKRGPFDQVK